MCSILQLNRNIHKIKEKEQDYFFVIIKFVKELQVVLMKVCSLLFYYVLIVKLPIALNVLEDFIFQNHVNNSKLK